MRTLSSPRTIRTVGGAVLGVIGAFGLASDGLRLAGILGSAWPWFFLGIAVLLLTADFWVPHVAQRLGHTSPPRLGLLVGHAQIMTPENRMGVFAAELVITNQSAEARMNVLVKVEVPMASGGVLSAEPLRPGLSAMFPDLGGFRLVESPVALGPQESRTSWFAIGMGGIEPEDLEGARFVLRDLVSGVVVAAPVFGGGATA